MLYQLTIKYGRYDELSILHIYDDFTSYLILFYSMLILIYYIILYSSLFHFFLFYPIPHYCIFSHSFPSLFTLSYYILLRCRLVLNATYYRPHFYHILLHSILSHSCLFYCIIYRFILFYITLLYSTLSCPIQSRNGVEVNMIVLLDVI